MRLDAVPHVLFWPEDPTALIAAQFAHAFFALLSHPDCKLLEAYAVREPPAAGKLCRTLDARGLPLLGASRAEHPRCIRTHTHISTLTPPPQTRTAPHSRMARSHRSHCTRCRRTAAPRRRRARSPRPPCPTCCRRPAWQTMRACCPTTRACLRQPTWTWTCRGACRPWWRVRGARTRAGSSCLPG